MSGEEEEALVQALHRLVKQGFPPTLGLLRHMAHSMVEAREQAPVPDIGKNWPCHFVQRHSDVLSNAWFSLLVSKRPEAGGSGVN